MPSPAESSGRYDPAAEEHVSPTAAAAAKAAGDAWNEGKVKQQQGERLYPLVCRLLTHGDVAPEHITGMLLDMPINHVEGLIADPDQLTKRIAECRDVVLRQRDAEASRFTTALAAAAAELGVDHSRLLDDVREVVDQWALAVTQQQGLPDDRAAAHLYVYGSYLLGVAGPESDVDVMIAVPAHICRVRHFFGLRAKDGDGGRGGDSLLERLRADKRVTDLMAVPDAFVPCIKLQFSGVDVDLTFANLQMPALPQQPATRASWAADIDHLTRSILSDLAADAPSLRSVNGVRASHALLKVVPDSVTFRRTLRMVKTWAQVRGVYGNTVGFLGGMSWAILTAKICQDFPGISPEHTLALFFRVYVSWQWPSAVRLRGCLPPNASEKSKALDDAVWNPDINPDDLRHHMPIITPIYPCMNSTFNLAPPNFRVVKSELDRAALITGPVLSGGVLAGSLHQSGRAFFFSRYEWYLQLDVVAADAEGTRKWMGLVQALLRHLIRTLESTRLFLVHPWPDLVVVKPEVKSETVRSLSNKKGKRPQPPKPAQSAYFLGLITEDGSSLSAPISEAVAEFQRLATMRAAGWYHKGMAVKEHVVRRSELPKCVKDEVESLTEPGNIPGRAVNHTDFCSGVDEHQLNLRETALMARNTGVAASKVPNIMSKRLAATSELERSRATEAQCTHDNLLVTCEELRAEKQSALQRLEAMKHTERRLTDKSKEQDKQRKKAEKAAKTSWRGQKEELESDLDNLRAALDKSNARANAAEKENRKLQASLAQAREEGRERPDTKSKSKSRERADTKTPSPPQSGKKNKGKERSKAAAKQPSNDGRKQTAAAETKPKPRRPSSGVATSGAATGKRRWAPGALLAEMQQRLQLSKMETLKPVLALLVAVVVAGLLAQTATRGGLLHGNQTGLDSICASLPCQHNGLCSAEGNDSYSCTCLDGFHGSACEHGEQGPGSSFNPSEWFEEAEKASVEPVADTEVCGDGPCLNGGVCETSLDFSGGPSDGKTCRCKEGYTGSSCETKLNVCQSMPCRNDGTCVDATSSYVCHCRHPWSGENCETNDAPCASNPCTHGEECSEEASGYICIHTPTNNRGGGRRETGMAQDLMRGLAEKPRTNQHHSWDVDPWAGYQGPPAPPSEPVIVGQFEDEDDGVPALAKIAFEEGLIRAEAREYEGAAERFRDALEHGHPDLARVHSRWGDVLYWRSVADGEDRFKSEAYEHISLAVALEPLVSEHWAIRGKIHGVIGRFELAERDLLRSIKLKPLEESDERKHALDRMRENAKSLQNHGHGQLSV